MEIELEVVRRDPATIACDGLIVPMAKTERLPRALEAIDAAVGHRIQSYLEAKDFEGNAEQVACFPVTGIEARRIVLVGLGDEKKADAESLRRAAGIGIRTLRSAKAKSAVLVAPALRRVAADDAGQAMAEGALLGAYRFDKYKTQNGPNVELASIRIAETEARHTSDLRKGAKLGETAATSANFARDLSNEPGSVHTPAWLADRARALGREHGLSVRVLGPRELERERMGGILAVGRGSANPPRLVVLEHRKPAKGRRSHPTIALVGKGVTFDSGGISIKPSESMDEMKHDMSGAAAVMGAMRAIAIRDLPLHVVGILGCAQNMPDGAAYLPGDVISTRSGKTIEVLNTDAEGRIVLADCLDYARELEPNAIVDLATLTGACMVALGSECCGLLGNDEKLLARVRAAGERVHELAWPLPLFEAHKKAVRGNVADVKNTAGRHAATSTAAAFLSTFVGDTPWAHLDIAGMAWTSSERPYCARGATGFGVRLLLELLQSWS